MKKPTKKQSSVPSSVGKYNGNIFDIKKHEPNGKSIISIMASVDDPQNVENEHPIHLNNENLDDDDLKNQDKSRKAYDKVFKEVIDAADVVLYVLDARDPESTRSKEVEKAILSTKNKRLILVLNKIDLIPTNVLKQWVDYLKTSFPTIPLRASSGAPNATTFNHKKLTQIATANSLLQALKTYANRSNLKRSITVGIIGYPNVGKSSIINSLISRHGNNSKVCPVGNQAGVTTSLREVKIDNKLKIIDSPGIVFPGEKSDDINEEARLVLLNALPPKQITDPLSAVSLLLKRQAQNNELLENICKLYEITPTETSSLDSFTKEFLIHVAIKRGRLGRGGIPNIEAAAMTILNDWRDGRIVGYVTPDLSKPVIDDKKGDNIIPALPTSASAAASKTEQAKVVSEWGEEFDLGDLFNDLDFEDEIMAD